jgi:hypothetical protein
MTELPRSCAGLPHSCSTAPLPTGILLNVNVPYAPAGRPAADALTPARRRGLLNYLVTGKIRTDVSTTVTGDPLTGAASGEGGRTSRRSPRASCRSRRSISITTEHGLLTALRSWETELDLAA